MVERTGPDWNRPCTLRQPAKREWDKRFKFLAGIAGINRDKSDKWDARNKWASPAQTTTVADCGGEDDTGYPASARAGSPAPALSVLALHRAMLTPPPRPVHRTKVWGHAVDRCSRYSVVTGVKMWGDKARVMM